MPGKSIPASSTVEVGSVVLREHRQGGSDRSPRKGIWQESQVKLSHKGFVVVYIFKLLQL